MISDFRLLGCSQIHLNLSKYKINALTIMMVLYQSFEYVWRERWFKNIGWCGNWLIRYWTDWKYNVIMQIILSVGATLFPNALNCYWTSKSRHVINLTTTAYTSTVCYSKWAILILFLLHNKTTLKVAQYYPICFLQRERCAIETDGKFTLLQR